MIGPGKNEARACRARALTLPPDRLLVFEVAEGWAPLCRFLGVPVPATPFPRVNSTAEFWELIQKSAS